MLCLPLYTLLLALGNPTVSWSMHNMSNSLKVLRLQVHYLSLDIEGGEMGVLRSLPWHKVDIWLLSVEVTRLLLNIQQLMFSAYMYF